MRILRHLPTLYKTLCAFAFFMAGTESALAGTSKSILELQTNSHISTALIAGKKLKLRNLNPLINGWYTLEIFRPGQTSALSYHLENRMPATQQFTLSSEGVRWHEGPNEGVCDDLHNIESIASAQKSGRSYARLCGDRLFLRNFTEGKESAKEWMTDFLRKNIWGGEQITTLVKDMLYKDRFLILSALSKPTFNANQVAMTGLDLASPQAALLRPESRSLELEPKDLGLSIAGFEPSISQKPLPVGTWLNHSTQQGVFVSLMQPGLVEKSILESFPNHVQKLDPIESAAMVYSIAFDLQDYQLGFSVGTKHPSVEWSERVLNQMRDPNTPGPDGFAVATPLVATGLINPDLAPGVIASFTGGFKRSHGAFKWGKLSVRNQGSHYGFIENGVVFSSLQPGLATLIVYENGESEMKTWTEKDKTSTHRIKHARQNGVAILDLDPLSQKGIPHELVGSWGPGNWSGSVDSKQRALRAGACIQRTNQRAFLIYSYFSSATPSAMARVFQSYRCQYAMHLDMNALEHTYLALYSYEKKALKIEHLITGMDVLDTKIGDKVIPRFLGAADNRDFFYLFKR